MPLWQNRIVNPKSSFAAGVLHGHAKRMRALCKGLIEAAVSYNATHRLVEAVAHRRLIDLMKTESRTQQDKESLSNKQPTKPRKYPLVPSSRRVARREEFQSQDPAVSSLRQTRRPTERSNQKRAHTR